MSLPRSHPDPLRAWLTGKLVNAETLRHEIDRARTRDPRGHAVHAVLAAVACFFVPWSTSYAELCLLPVAVMTLLRIWCVWPVLLRALAQPVSILVLLFGAWLWLGLAWTPAPLTTAIDEPANLRWCIAIGLFLPVIDHRRWLIAALAAGLVCGQLVQLAQLVGLGDYTNRLGRVSGFWDPAVAGGVLTVAAAIHLPAALMAKGHPRWLATILLLPALAGLLATGARGGWLATAALLTFALIYAARHGRPARALTLAAIIALAAAVTTIAPVRDRAAEGVQEAIAGFQGDSSSATGARVAMSEWAIKAWWEQPIIGVGTAGYAYWARETHADAPPDLHDHAHNTWAHLAGCNGLVGVVLFGGVLGAGLATAFRYHDAPYDLAPAFALVGLGFFSFFDTLYASGQSAAMLGVVLGLSPAGVRTLACRARTGGAVVRTGALGARTADARVRTERPQ